VQFERATATYGGQGKAAGFDPLAGGFAANPQMTTRRFPPPWSVDHSPNCFIVRDANAPAVKREAEEDWGQQ
jgi:hypothetical protein